LKLFDVKYSLKYSEKSLYSKDYEIHSLIMPSWASWALVPFQNSEAVIKQILVSKLLFLENHYSCYHRFIKLSQKVYDREVIPHPSVLSLSDRRLGLVREGSNLESLNGDCLVILVKLF